MTTQSRDGLTGAGRRTLLACPDWSAPYEIMYRRNAATGEIVDPGGLINVLGRLRNLGLVEYSMLNNVYRITAAGRAALAGEER